VAEEAPVFVSDRPLVLQLNLGNPFLILDLCVFIPDGRLELIVLDVVVKSSGDSLIEQ